MPSKSVQKKSGWKDVQSKNRVKKQSKLAIAVLGLVGIILLISWTIQSTRNLFSPLQSTSKIQRNYVWNKEFNINLLIRTDKISLLSYNPKEEKVTLINIPDETFLDVPYGFGNWQLRSVYGLGESQKDLGGDKLLTYTLTDLLGVPIDGFLDFKDLQPQTDVAKLVTNTSKNPFSGVNFLSKLRTNLTLWELIKLKLGMMSVRFDKVQQIDLAKGDILDKSKLADSTAVFTADPIKLDSIIQGLQDPTIVAEHKTVAVYNATDYPQFAQKWARLITNLGGNVVITSNAKARLKYTEVVGEQSQTLKRLQQIFVLKNLPLSKEKGRIDPKDEDLISSRAQINVFLGEDYFNR